MINDATFNKLRELAESIQAGANAKAKANATAEFIRQYNDAVRGLSAPDRQAILAKYYRKDRSHIVQSTVESLSAQSFPPKIEDRKAPIFKEGTKAVSGAVAGATKGKDAALQAYLAADPKGEFQINDALLKVLKADKETVESVVSALREEGITTNGQAAAFFANAQKMGLSINKMQQLGAGIEIGEDEDPEAAKEKLQASMRSGIRLVQQATLADPKQQGIIPKIQKVVDASYDFDELQDKLMDESDKKNNGDLRNFLGGFMLQESMGLDSATSDKFASMLNKFGLSPKLITSAFKNIKDLGKELFFEQSVYYDKDRPLYDQVASRFAKPYRAEAISEVEKRQSEAGIHNFQKLFGMTEATARQWHGFLSNPSVRNLSDNVLRTLMTKAGLSEDKVDAFMENKDALLDGFAGDAVSMYDRMAKDVTDVDAMMQVGQAASVVALGPTVENKWARAEDMSAAFSVMRQAGWNVEDHIVRDDRDMRTALRRMGGDVEGINAQFAQEWAATQADNKAWSILATGKTPEELKKLRKARSTYMNASADKKEKRKAEAILGDDYLNKYKDAYDTAYNTAKTEADKFAETGRFSKKVDKDLREAYTRRVGGEAIVHEIAPVRNALQNVMMFMNQVPEAAKLNGGRKIDEQKANELVRALGGSNYNGDYVDYGRRTVHMAQMAARNDIPLERLISAVAESGKTLQQMGLSPALTQVVGEAGMTVFDAAFRSSGGMVDADKLMAQTQQDAAHVANSEISRNLTWVIANANNPAFKKELQELAQRAKDKKLTAEDIAHLRNTGWLRTRSGMSGEEWEQSRNDASFTYNLSNMGHEQALYVHSIARAANQKEFIDTLNNDRFRSVWDASISEATASKAGYEDREQLRNYSTALMQTGMTAKRRAEILSGRRGMTTEEEKQFRETAKRLGINGVDEMITRFRAQEKAYLDNPKNNGFRDNLFDRYMQASNAVANEMGETLESQDAHLRLWNDERIAQDLRIQHFQEQAPMDLKETTVEQMVTSGKKGGSWAGEFLKLWFGGYQSPEKAKALLANGIGGGIVLTRALQEKNADRFFKFLLGDHDTPERRRKLIKDLGLGTMSEKDAYEELKNKTGQELQDIARKSQSFSRPLYKSLTATKKEEQSDQLDAFQSGEETEPTTPTKKGKKGSKPKKGSTPKTKGGSPKRDKAEERRESPEEGEKTKRKKRLEKKRKEKKGTAPPSESTTSEEGDSPSESLTTVTTEPTQEDNQSATSSSQVTTDGATNAAPVEENAKKSSTQHVHVDNFKDIWV